MFSPHDIPEDDSQSEDEELCKIEEEDEPQANIQQEEDEHHDENHAKLQLEEDEQLARAIQESLNINSPPREDTGSLFQPFSQLFSPGYR